MVGGSQCCYFPEQTFEYVDGDSDSDRDGAGMGMGTHKA